MSMDDTMNGFRAICLTKSAGPLNTHSGGSELKYCELVTATRLKFIVDVRTPGYLRTLPAPFSGLVSTAATTAVSDAKPFL